MNTHEGLSLPAAAKINLYLHVTGKRPDGYHLLDSLVAFATAHDQITIRPANQLSLVIDGPFGRGLPVSDDNLVLRAALQLRALAGIHDGAQITLTKNLPVASGIGGGSADAAATIRGLVRLWQVHPGLHDLSGLALGLGADVPVCLLGRAAYMGGIGELLDPVDDLPAVPLVLVNPAVAVATPEVFTARAGGFSPANRFPAPPSGTDELIELLNDGRGNDLAAPAIGLIPVIGRAIERIAATNGCRMARMSGSGATCFGLYQTQAEADAAALAIGQAEPHWWSVAGHLLSNIHDL